jgi:putative addiction module component (TIGR02574 family)
MHRKRLAIHENFLGLIRCRRLLLRVLRFVSMGKVSVADVLQLSIPERIKLVEDIWDSIASVPEQIALSPAQREELDRRLQDYHQHPDEGSPWEEVRTRLLASGR